MVLRSIGVTGATGMLGRHVVVRLERAGHVVVPFTRQHAEDGARRWDLTTWPGPRERAATFGGLDAIVHCAAVIAPRDPEDGFLELFDANVRACAMLGEWALGASVPIVFISSAAVYERPDARGIQESDPVAWSGLGGAYALSKILAEAVFERLRYRGLQVAIIRPSSLYGVGEPVTRIVSKFLDTAAAGRDLELSPPFDDGFNLVHAADVANAVAGVLRSGAWKTYNVPGGSTTSLEQLAEACVAVSGQGRVKRLESPGPARPPKVRFDLDAAAAARDFGYTPLVDLTTGLRALRERHVLSVGGEANG